MVGRPARENGPELTYFTIKSTTFQLIKNENSSHQPFVTRKDLLLPPPSWGRFSLNRMREESLVTVGNCGQNPFDIPMGRLRQDGVQSILCL